MTFDISFSWSLWFWLIGVTLIVFFSRWVYKTTIPPVAPVLKKLLLGLRVFVLALLLLLFFKPEILLERTYSEQPVVAVLIDGSSSMQLLDSLDTRANSVKKLLRQPWFEKLKKRAGIETAEFADTLRFLPTDFSPDSLRFARDGTDISTALMRVQEALRERNFAAVLLLSDGAQNLGPDPVTALTDYPAPIFSVPFGREQAPKDIWIDDVITNDVAFAGAKIPVEVVVRSTGFAGHRAELRISSGGESVQKILELPADLVETRQILYFSPQSPGLQKLTVTLSELPDEVTVKNNRRVVYQKVLKSKMKIALLAGAPSADLGFLLQTLRQDENLEVRVFQALAPGVRRPARLPSEEEIRDFDCIIALNMAAVARPDARLTGWLKKAVLDREKPLFFISGPIASETALREFQRMLDLVSLQRSRETEITVRPTGTGALHPVLVAESGKSIEAWADLPPVYGAMRKLEFAPHVRILAVAQPLNAGEQKNERPFLTAARTGKRRTITVFGAGLWRWHLMMKNIDPENTVYRDVVLNAVRWLVSAEDSKLLRIKLPAEVFRAGETIPVSVQAYYEDFRPRDDVQVTLTLEKADGRLELSTQSTGNGGYRGSVQVIGEGDYRLLARAEAGGRIVAADTAAFSVIPFQLEFRDTRANPRLLRKLAQQTGGRLLQPDSLQQWVDEHQFREREIREKRSYALWVFWPVLMLLIALLSLEWFVRKKKGML